MVVQTKMADISLVPRVRTRQKTWQEQQEDNSNKKTTALWRIFAELKNRERTLSKMNLTSMEVSMFRIKQLLNSTFVSYEALWRSTAYGLDE